MKLIFSHLTNTFYGKIKNNPLPVLYSCADEQEKSDHLNRTSCPDVVTKVLLRIQVYIINSDSFSQGSFDSPLV